MRKIEIKKVIPLENGAIAEINDDDRVQLMASDGGGNAVIYTEKYVTDDSHGVSAPVSDHSQERDREFKENWQIKAGAYWLHGSEGLKEKKYMPEVYFETVTSKKILSIFESFVSNVEVARKYKKLKRSYLIHSHPGYGKSAMVRHFCRKIQNLPGICVIQTDGGVDFNILTNMFNSDYRDDVKMIVLIIEDMGTKDHSRNLNVYNSSCLNFLDGASGLFRVPTMIFATTNYAKELGAQFTNRPGRFNRIIKADLPNDEEVFALVEAITEEKLSAADKEAFAGKKLTPDHCVEAIMRSKIEGMTMAVAVQEILHEREGVVDWDK
jgi:hypothetical protein